MKRGLFTGSSPRIALALLVIAIAPTVYRGEVSAKASYKHEETTSRTLALEGAERLILGNKRGDLIVEGRKDRHDIEIRLTKKIRAENEEAAKNLAEETDIEISRSGDALKIIAEYSGEAGARESIISYLFKRFPKVEMNIVLSVPYELAIEAYTASGDIVIDNIGGAVEAKASSGSIRVSNTGSSADISVSSGDILVEGIGGPAVLRSASGDIWVKTVGGDLTISSSSGDVSVVELVGDLQLRTSSGDSQVKGAGSVSYASTSGSGRLYGIRGDVDAAASSGDLMLRLVPDKAARYKVRTASGDIDFVFERQLKEGYFLVAETTSGSISANLAIRISKVDRHRLTGKVREGKSKISLETASGDIAVSEPEE